MLSNHLRIAFRHFRKSKISTGINILGLFVGISASLIIFMIVKYDYSFDKHEPDGDRIYRLVTDGEGWKSQGVPVPFVSAMPNGLSGVEVTATIFEFNDWSIRVRIPKGNRVFKKQEKVVFADAGYFAMFPHTWLAGAPAAALQQPNTLVLSESRAKVYFPGVPPNQLIGQTVVFSDTIITTITGIVADQGYASDFNYESFISLPTVFSNALKKAYQTDEWNSTSSANQVLVKLSPHVQPGLVEKQIAGIFREHITGDHDTNIKHRLQQLSDVHINPDYSGHVNPSTLRYLGLLAVFLLALGAINFINLSTAQASVRAREIGLRKILGGLKTQLIGQFLTETFLLTIFTTLLSISMLSLLLKAFDGFIPTGLDAGFVFKEPAVWGFLILLITLVSLLAGLYPAYVLTRFQPIAVLKTKVAGAKNVWLRRGLIIVQFVIAQVFLIGVLVVEKQVRYALNKDMGFRKDAIINFYVPMDFANPNDKKFVLKREISKLSGVQEVSLGNMSPAINGSMTTDVTYLEGGKDIKIDVSSRNGDTSFLKVYGIPLMAGRNILSSDTASELLINETLARKIGFKQSADALGHTLLFDGKNIPIVGIMRDFNQASVRTAVTPLIYYAAPKFGYVMHISLFPDPAGWSRTIENIQRSWESVYPNVDFDYSFLDQQIEKFYNQERQLSKLLTWSAGVAMLVSCLGMLGLVIFITNTRVKEIGVRKVLGATVLQIILLLSADFAKLLVIAFVIAVPIAWWEAHQWLQNFAYHTALNWWLFGLSGSLMLIIALLIVGARAGKAAIADPVKNLRME